MISEQPLGCPSDADRQAESSPAGGEVLVLTYAGVAFLAGIALAGAGMPWLLPILGCLLAALLVWRHARWVWPLVAIACALAAGLGSWRLTSTAFRDSPDQAAYYLGRAATLTGVVDGEPQPAGQGVEAPVRVTSLTLSAAPMAVGGRVLLYYTGPQELAYGDSLSLIGRLQAPQNPPGFDYAGYLARQGIHAEISFPSLTLQARNAGNPVQGWAYAARDRLRRSILALLPREMAALLIGILLGAPSRTLGTLAAPFVRAGMVHVVAISGLKVALVAGVATALCASLPFRLRWLPALAVVAGYALISGATPSGLRSALMWLLALAAIQLGRRGYVWVSLAVVAAGMACWNPLLIWDTGFQLSVAGTAGIVAFTGSLERRLTLLPPLLRQSTAVALAAQLATLPITAGSFGQVSLVGPLANGLLVPLLGPIMLLGGLAAVVGVVSVPLGHLCAFGVYPVLAFFAWAVQALAALPLAAFPASSVNIGLTALYYAGGVAFFFWRAPSRTSGLPWLAGSFWPDWRGLPRSFLAGCLALGLTVPVALDRPSGVPRLIVAGVGGGTVVLAEGPHGQVVLLDGGSTATDLQALLGRHLPFWQRQLSAVLLSAPDTTHLNGLLGLTTLYAVGRESDGGTFYPSAHYATWRAELRDSLVTRAAARTGQRLDFGDGLRVDVLEPDGLTLDAEPPPVAYRLQAAGLSLLLVNIQAAEAADADPGPLQADGRCLDILVLPAGLDDSLALSLAQALRPRLVVLPASSGAAGGLPALLARDAPSVRQWTAAIGREMSADGSLRACR